MSDRPRGRAGLAWLLPLAVLAIVLALMPSDDPGSRRLPFNEALTLVEQGAIKRAELQTRDNFLKLWTADDTRYETGYLPDNGSELIAKLPGQSEEEVFGSEAPPPGQPPIPGEPAPERPRAALPSTPPELAARLTGR